MAKRCHNKSGGDCTRADCLAGKWELCYDWMQKTGGRLPTDDDKDEQIMKTLLAAVEPLAQRVHALERKVDSQALDMGLLGDELGNMITECIDRALAPHVEKIDAIPARINESTAPWAEKIEAIQVRVDNVKDGDPGVSVSPDTVAKMIRADVERAVAEFPVPKDGTNGFVLDDLDIQLEGERTVVFTVCSGNRQLVKKVHLPIPIDRGIYRSGQAYEKGDGVTYAGHFWLAQGSTKESPGTGPADLWRLVIRKPKDGQDLRDVIEANAA